MIFKIRASACYLIMAGTDGITDKQLVEIDRLQNKEKLTDKQQIALAELIAKRDAPPSLSTGAKTYCKLWVKQNIVYLRTREYSNRYTEKGEQCEPEAIEMIARRMGYGMVSKNEVWYENEWMTGTPDLITSECTDDAKCSWDGETFPLFEPELPDSAYYWQGQVYMCLTRRERHGVNYCLLNAPDELIDREARFVAQRAGLTEVDMDLYEEVRARMTYDDIDEQYRHKRYEFTYDESAIAKVKQQVILCREYITNELLPMINVPA